MQREIISRRIAIALGLDRYFTGKPCINGHVAERHIGRQCVECLKASGKAYETLREASRRRSKEYYERNRDRINANNRKYNKANWEKKAAYDKAWNAANIDRVRATRKASYDRNVAKRREKSSTYRAMKLQATPPWLTHHHHELMNSIYADAVLRTDETGVFYEVDHIVPLAGRKVAGLHVPWNLHVITREENRSKSNLLLLDYLKPIRSDSPMASIDQPGCSNQI